MFSPLHTLTHGPLTVKIPTEPPRWVMMVLSATAEKHANSSPNTPTTNNLIAQERFVAAGIVRLTSSDPDCEVEWPKLDPLAPADEIDEALERRHRIVTMLPQSFFGEIAEELQRRSGLTAVEEGNSAAE